LYGVVTVRPSLLFDAHRTIRYDVCRTPWTRTFDGHRTTNDPARSPDIDPYGPATLPTDVGHGRQERSDVVRLVDLRGTPTPAGPAVEVRASAGAELLRCAGVLLTEDPGSFDIGATRVAEVRDRTPPELLDDLVTLSGPQGDKGLLLLAAVAATTPPPGTIEQVLEALATDELLPWRVLADRRLDDDWPTEQVEGVLAGDTEALRRLQATVEEGRAHPELAALLSRPPAEYRDLLVDVIERFDRQVFADLVDEAMGAIDRDVAHRRQQLEDGADAADVVLEATNGFELVDDPTLRRIVLLPSYWCRPWLVLGRLGDTEMLSSPVAEQFVVLPSEAPPPSLVKLFKALGDEGRLKLLRRMSTGPVTLADAVDELGVAKATAHHHLSILRQAGLVSLRDEDRRTTYGLRDDPRTVAGEALAAYLRPPRRDVTDDDGT
jgi:DNA-binding transcriptional ArsR family regulator